MPANKEVMEAIVGMYNERFIYRRCNRFGTSNLPNGEYDAVLISSAGDSSTASSRDELARVRFAVRESAAHHPKLTVSTPSFVINNNDSLWVEWTNTLGDRHDFIAIYRNSTVDVNNYVGLLYTGGKFNGKALLDFTDQKIFPVPLVNGNYKALLMSNDQFVELARINFEIIAVDS